MGHPVTFRSDPRIMPGTAEPRILIEGDLLHLFEKHPGDDAVLQRAEGGEIVGSLLRMEYKGHRLLYRITGVAYPATTFERAIYSAEWPD